MVDFNISLRDDRKKIDCSRRIRSNTGCFTEYMLLYKDLPSVQSLIIFLSQLHKQEDEKALKQSYLSPEEF